jgi:hypothetical protein
MKIQNTIELLKQHQKDGTPAGIESRMLSGFRKPKVNS